MLLKTANRSIPSILLMSTLACVGSTVLIRSALAAQDPVKVAPSPSVSNANGSSELATRLQNYFADSKKQLGPLESWQKKLFDDEAVPEYQRFMRGYRFAANATNPSAPPTLAADIDFDSLKDFLRFYAPKSLKREKPPILAYLKPQTNCTKCMAGVSEIKALVANRLDHRGFKILWVAPAEVEQKEQTGAELQARLQKLSIDKKAVGWLLVDWHNALEDIDYSHPDTRHYSVHNWMEIRDVAKSHSQIELTQSGSFERSEAKLLADAFTELGVRMNDLETTQSEIKKEEIALNVTGFHSFVQYQLVKNAIQDILKTSTVNDQKISNGKAVFAVFSDQPVQKIHDALAGAKPVGVQWAPPVVEGNELKLELLAAENPVPAVERAPAPQAALPVHPEAPAGEQPQSAPSGDPET